MNVKRALCCLVMVAGLLLAPAANAAELAQAAPGPRIVIRDSGINEGTFVAPRQPLTPRAKVKTATFDVTYTGFTAEAQAAFQAAVDIWSNLVSSPVTIRVEANWEELEEDDVLGQAGANFVNANFPGAPQVGVWYPDAIADALRGSDNNSGEPDILATFNSSYTDWYFGTDGKTPSGKSDFVSVVLHELGHGLGFSSSAAFDDSALTGSVGLGDDSWPKNYDLLVQDGSGTAITDDDVYPNDSTELADAFQSNDLWWGGSEGTAAASGSRPRLYAPSTWDPGSSVSHLNETTYPAGNPNSLMTPKVGRAEAIHDPGPITLGMFRDLGWGTSEDFSYWVAAAARASGSGGSEWRTTLSMYNRSASKVANIEVRYVRKDGNVFSETLTLPAGHQRVIADVVNFVGSNQSGSLQVISDQPLIVGSRTFNQGPEGTFGQYLDGAPSSEGVDGGQSVFLTMLDQSSDFRTNIGFTNTGSATANLTVTLYDNKGAQVAEFSVTVQPGRNRQENEPYRNKGGRTDIKGGTAVVTVTSGSGVQIYASLVDQKTGDATTIPAKQ